MALPFNRLTAVQVRTLGPGRHADGRGLYLLVRPGGGAWWTLRYKRKGWVREAGIGPARGGDALTLAEARAKADGIWRMHKGGLDPLAEKQAAAKRAAADAQDRQARAVTFRAAAEAHIQAFQAGWKNPKHRAQWSATLEAYAYPHMGALPVAEVETPHVLAVLEPIWRTKPETATRVRGRIEVVLDYARVSGWRRGENPARWRGHLGKLLPARAKVAAVEHHAALPWAEVGAFMAELAKLGGVAALALRYAILTAARTGEVIGATWGEVDMQAGVWTIPAVRMKAKREHRVPLSAAAVAILAEAAKLCTSEDPGAPVFRGGRGARGLSNMALLMTLRRMKRDNMTAHGFRSTFRDWVAEHTAFPREVAEAALAHILKNKSEAAYQRGDMFHKRRAMMAAWATFCAAPYVKPEAGKVVQLYGAA
jgi:integrase